MPPASRLRWDRQRVYGSALAAIGVWLDGRGADSITLIEYITHLHGLGRALSSVNVVCAAVKWACMVSGVELIFPHPSVIEGIRRQSKDEKRGIGQVAGL